MTLPAAAAGVEHRGKWALITGASSGIGRALAEQFARDGYGLILTARGEAILAAVAQDLARRFAVPVQSIPCDLAVAGGAAELCQRLRAHGLHVDVLVNNAGAGLCAEFKLAPLERELAMMQLNMLSLVALTKLLLPDLCARGGAMINVASTAAFQPGPYKAIYYASKSFVLSFTAAIGDELRHEVRVMALCPGPTASNFQRAAALDGTVPMAARPLPAADEVARAGYAAFKRGRRVFVPGTMNQLLAFGCASHRVRWCCALRAR